MHAYLQTNEESMTPPRTNTSSLFLRALVLIVLSCTGCASLAPANPPPEFIQTHCGNKVLMLPDRIEACPAGTGGCAWKLDTHAWAITYPSNSNSVKEHEIEHVCGMTHREPWVAAGLFTACAEVIDGGSTAWTPGQVMCRRLNGDVRIEKDPAVIERVRKLHSQKNKPGATLISPD